MLQCLSIFFWNICLQKSCCHFARITSPETFNLGFKVFNIGTHIFDTVRMLIGRDARMVSGRYSSQKTADPSVSGWVLFKGGIPCTIISKRRSGDLVFEIDLIGTKGRVRILDNGEKIEKSSNLSF